MDFLGVIVMVMSCPRSEAGRVNEICVAFSGVRDVKSGDRNFYTYTPCMFVDIGQRERNRGALRTLPHFSTFAYV